jgi:hypothetical protein
VGRRKRLQGELDHALLNSLSFQMLAVLEGYPGVSLVLRSTSMNQEPPSITSTQSIMPARPRSFGTDLQRNVADALELCRPIRIPAIDANLSRISRCLLAAKLGNGSSLNFRSSPYRDPVGELLELLRKRRAVNLQSLHVSVIGIGR